MPANRDGTSGMRHTGLSWNVGPLRFVTRSVKLPVAVKSPILFAQDRGTNNWGRFPVVGHNEERYLRVVVPLGGDKRANEMVFEITSEFKLRHISTVSRAYSRSSSRRRTSKNWERLTKTHWTRILVRCLICYAIIDTNVSHHAVARPSPKL